MLGRCAPKAAWALLPIAWILLLGTGSVVALLLPLNMILIPCWIAVGSSLGALTREVLDPTCPGCGALRGSGGMPERSAARGRATDLAGGASGPAHEGAVEAGLVREA